VESFLPENVSIKIITDKKTGKLNNILSVRKLPEKLLSMAVYGVGKEMKL
jgi:hypothetical protein